MHRRPCLQALEGLLVAALLPRAAGAALAPLAGGPRPAPLTVEQIVARNAQARGGVEAWRRITAMAWTGRAEAGTAPERSRPFLLEQQRPNRTRFELVVDGGLRSVRAFDGSVGWKQRPNPATGQADVQPYTPQELAFAQGATVIEGPLMDYVAKAAALQLVGEGDVDGRPAFVLDVKLASGGVQRVWVDQETLLEVRHDRSVRGASGAGSMVTVLFREYRDFQGLKLPTVVETTAEPGRPANRLVIERVALNPPIEESAFAKPPERIGRNRRIVVDTRSAARP